jgi:hypothetical protein
MIEPQAGHLTQSLILQYVGYAGSTVENSMDLFIVFLKELGTRGSEVNYTP